MDDAAARIALTGQISARLDRLGVVATTARLDVLHALAGVRVAAVTGLSLAQAEAVLGVLAGCGSGADLAAAIGQRERAAAEQPGEVVEYGQLMASGGFAIFDASPEVEAVYPMADRVQAGKRLGFQVRKRRIVVLSDWEDAGG
jgi:hypothetical protein